VKEGAAIPLAGRAMAETGYLQRAGLHDEMVDATGAVRPLWRPFVDAWLRLGAEGRAQIARDARRQLDETGLSFNPFVEDVASAGADLRFEVTPVLLSTADWTTLSRGAEQRARMIEAALHDIHGPQTLITQGALPPAAVFGGPGFIPAAARWDRPPRRRMFRYAVDVARTAAGDWVVLDDAVDRPEGDGWALANRVALGQAASELFVDSGVHRLASHFDTLQESLEAETGIEGRIAYVTTGPSDPAYFSQSYLARYMGLTLVEPGDLAVRDGEAHVKTLEGLRRVDVLLRGAPSDGIDPLYAPGLGAMAPPGILRAARLGRVCFANAVGASVFEGRALAPFSAGLIGRLIGETPILREAPALWLGDPEARAEWRRAPEAWRVTHLRAPSRPGAPRPDPLAGLSAEAATRLAEREGWRMIARAPVETGVAPTLGGAGLAPRGWALRLFVVAGPDGWRTMPGGLAFATGEPAIVGLPWSGASRDVWVVDDPAARLGQPAATVRLNQRRRTAHLRRTGRDLLSRVADDLFWLGRYVERGDFTLRVLKVVIERMIDAPRRDAEPRLLHRLLSLRLGEAGAPEDWALAALRGRIATLALDPAEPKSAPRTIESIYWNANRTRAHLSRDAWRDVGALHADPIWKSPPDPNRALALGGAVEEAVRKLAAFAGASHENMTRNFAWRFLELGRRLQRGMHVAQMFRALAVEPDDDEAATLYALLLLCDSFFAYRARYLTTPEATPAIDLLILDEGNPRSLAFQVAQAESVLDQLPRQGPHRNPEHRLALKLLTDLRVSDPAALGETDATGRRAALAELADGAEETLAAVADQVAKAYFAHAEQAMTEVSAARREDLR
jgi:uncharacterized circularly permuted ATP-grasp superfamily protein/uncharacterized alpha-E superfamily protein